MELAFCILFGLLTLTAQRLYDLMLQLDEHRLRLTVHNYLLPEGITVSLHLLGRKGPPRLTDVRFNPSVLSLG